MIFDLQEQTGDGEKRNGTAMTWIIVFGLWVAGHLADITIKHGHVALVEFMTALVTGVVVASAVAYAVHRRRAR
jgi:hypothetical protein